jgi:hypothetical protein
MRTSRSARYVIQDKGPLQRLLSDEWLEGSVYHLWEKVAG